MFRSIKLCTEKFKEMKYRQTLLNVSLVNDFPVKCLLVFNILISQNVPISQYIFQLMFI